MAINTMIDTIPIIVITKQVGYLMQLQYFLELPQFYESLTGSVCQTDLHGV